MKIKTQFYTIGLLSLGLISCANVNVHNPKIPSAWSDKIESRSCEFIKTEYSIKGENEVGASSNCNLPTKEFGLGSSWTLNDKGQKSALIDLKKATNSYSCSDGWIKMNFSPEGGASFVAGLESHKMNLTQLKDRTLILKKSTNVAGVALFVIPTLVSDTQWCKFSPIKQDNRLVQPTAEAAAD